MARINKIVLVFFLFITQLAFAQSSFIPQNLGPNINSAYDEIYPVISPDRKAIFFTRNNHPKNAHGSKNTADIWYASFSSKEGWLPAEPLAVMNIGKHNAALSISADGKQLLLLNDNELCVSEKDNNGWTTPKKLSVKATSSACLSGDGNFLIYAKGGKLNKVEKDSAGHWGKPMPFNIDAKGITNPYITADNKTLFYSAKRKDRGMDVFKIQRESESSTTWGLPVSLNDTINSALTEDYMRTNPNGAWGYYSSNNKSTGKADIFMVKLFEDRPYVMLTGKVVNEVTKRPLTNESITIMVNGEEAKSFTINKDSATYSLRVPFGEAHTVSAKVEHYGEILYQIDATSDKEFREVKLNLEEKPLPYILLKGRLLVKNTDKIIPALANPKIIVDGEEVDSASVDKTTGAYALKLNHGLLYYIQVSAKRYESFPEVVDLKDLDGYKEITLDLQADAEKMAIVRGSIIDKRTGNPLVSTEPKDIKVEGVASSAANIDSLSSFEVRLPLREKHIISAVVPGYYPVYEMIDMSDETKEVEVQRNLVMVPFEVGQSVRLNNIFFEPGKTVINEASYPALERLITFLEANPKVRIEIGGHTDKSTKISTLNMAKNVMSYITSKGIAKNRIAARGYASTKPLANSKTPNAKSLNSRIEFTILSK